MPPRCGQAPPGGVQLLEAGAHRQQRQQQQQQQQHCHLPQVEVEARPGRSEEPTAWKVRELINQCAIIDDENPPLIYIA